MNETLTTLKLVENVLETVEYPLSGFEIWSEAKKLGLDKRSSLKGKTPWATVLSSLYIDIRDNPTTIFTMHDGRPLRFSLKERGLSTESIRVQERNEILSPFNERDLHPLVVRFINGNEHFHSHVRTIFHEKTLTARKGFNEWLHPDLIGVYYPFNDYDLVTLEIQKYLSISAVKFYSFELKKTLGLNTLRQCYFQAVSNSSWAHEGYLVVGEMDKNTDLEDELRRLNSAFGIGVILLNLESIDESEVILPARVNNELDWNTINRLVEENKDFKELMKDVQDSLKIGKVVGKYDLLLDSDEKLLKYLDDKKIKIASSV
jgi:hypothetical protein